MTDLMQELEDAGQEETQTVDLSAITALAEKQVSLEGEVDRLESLLKEKKAELNKIALDELPAAMQAAGMANFALLTGQKVSVKEEMTISVPKKRKDEILDKVREMGYGDLISNVVTVPVAKGQDEQVESLMQQATALGFDAMRSQDVNSASLKKVLNDRRKDGINDDLPFFGAFVITKATIK